MMRVLTRVVSVHDTDELESLGTATKAVVRELLEVVAAVDEVCRRWLAIIWREITSNKQRQRKSAYRCNI